jgi:hypothetical protein
MKTRKVLSRAVIPLVAISLLGVFLVAKNVALSQTSERESKKGLFTFVEGEAKKQKIGDLDWEKAQINTEVASGERVRTMLRTRAEIELAKLELIRLAPKTTVDIVRLYEETQQKKAETELKLEEGDLWANIASLKEASELSVGTTIANASVRGTVFRVNVQEDQTTELRVYKGRLEVSNIPDTSGIEKEEEKEPKSLAPKQIEGPREIEPPKEVTLAQWTVIVREMQELIITPDKKIKHHGEFKASDQEEQTAWVKWNQERDRRLR